MPIRFATAHDIPGLIALGRTMHAASRFKHIDYDESRVARSFQHVLDNERNRHVLLVAQGGGERVVGMLLGVLERHIFTDLVTASVMHFLVLPERRMGGYAPRLLLAFERWAANRGAAEIAFGVNSGIAIDATARFAKRMGFEKVGENFVRSTQ